MMVKRYGLYENGMSEMAYKGDYVTYSDYAALCAKYDIAHKQRNDAWAEIERLQEQRGVIAGANNSLRVARDELITERDELAAKRKELAAHRNLLIETVRKLLYSEGEAVSKVLYVPTDNGGGLCANCQEQTGMHYQTAEGYLFCMPEFGSRGQKAVEVSQPAAGGSLDSILEAAAQSRGHP